MHFDCFIFYFTKDARYKKTETHLFHYMHKQIRILSLEPETQTQLFQRLTILADHK